MQANTHNRDSQATDQQRRALRRVNDALRSLIRQKMRLDAPAEHLDELAGHLEQLAANNSPYVIGRALEYYKPDHGGDINAVQPYSPISGLYNPIAPIWNYQLQSDRLTVELTLDDVYEGPPNCIHGGIIAGVFDQLLAMFSTTQGVAGPTLYLNVQYLKPTPLYQPLRFEAFIERIEGKKVFTIGQCRLGDEVLSKAEALFINQLMTAPAESTGEKTLHET
ncbi:PaaI family thioesterase [Pseudomaricurvus alkylphenolicus]|uniref:PaaI family thioesterase n=1 Tax=Pseudomaricurvus alkylphenolicus TaxID=1306991 RepID=UPI001422F655|nr:PaaI family thioesterase [Pseudomaricurvus alkylphenolicus]NIB39816.1 PaaI family thioesterase [Pseudomaricurvus alkylphenolicus]